MAIVISHVHRAIARPRPIAPPCQLGCLANLCLPARLRRRQGAAGLWPKGVGHGSQSRWRVSAGRGSQIQGPTLAELDGATEAETSFHLTFFAHIAVWIEFKVAIHELTN